MDTQVTLTGSIHPEVARLTRKLSKMLWESGQETEAHKMQERHVMVMSRLLGPNHPRLLHALVQLAAMNLHGGAMDEAKYYQNGARILVELTPRVKAVMGFDHTVTLQCLLMQGKAYARLGLVKAGTASLEEALSLEKAGNTNKHYRRHPFFAEAEVELEKLNKLSEHDTDPMPSFMDNGVV